MFLPLQSVLRSHQLPVPLLEDLLSAFAQDVEKTRDGEGYADRDELLDYCRRSANPVGRLLLHLYGITDAQALQRSDAICTALQLINFWQDLSEDLPRGRFYLTEADCQRFGITRQDLQAAQVTPAMHQLLADSSAWAAALMHAGQDLVHQLPGRIGWELRLVVQGGWAILRKVQAQHGGNLHTRLQLNKGDWPGILWRALRMQADQKQ